MKKLTSRHEQDLLAHDGPSEFGRAVTVALRQLHPVSHVELRQERKTNVSHRVS